MSHENTTATIRTEPTPDSNGPNPCPESTLNQNRKKIDDAVSELLTVRGELDLTHHEPETAIRDFTLALQFNSLNHRAALGKARAEILASNGTRDPKFDFRPMPSIGSSPPVFRVNSGYRVIAVYPDNDFFEDHRPIYEVADSPEGRRLALNHAKQIAQNSTERSKLDNTYQVDDPDFTASVQRVHCLIETVALFAPVDTLETANCTWPRPTPHGMNSDRAFFQKPSDGQLTPE